MAPPKLPAIHGRSGMEKSASMPRIEAPHPLTVPNFRRPDVSGQLQEIGQLSSKIVGPGGISKKMRALTASSSTPNLRGKPEPELRPEVSLEPSPPRSTGGTAYPAAAPAEVAEEKKLEYRKHPEKAHFNFRNLPLEIFDHTPDFEVKTPQEWMEEVLKDTSRPQACVVHYKRKEWTMVRCWVLRYEEAINRYVVELEDATHKKVKRLSLRFNAEDPKNFERRVETCRARKAHCELQEAFIDYIEYKDDKVVTPMPRSMKEFFIRSCLERCSLQEPNSHASTIRELMQEVEENYVLSMKLFNVEVELIPLFGTKEAFLPDESNEFSLKFEPVMRSFLPRPCPESGLVEHAKPEMAVKQLIAEMRQMPLLGANIFAITNQVWRRYMNEVAKLELIDTTRVGGVDVTRQRKLVKNSDSILFESQDMFEHQKNHIERITTHLKRGWRDYIIAEVLDKLSDDYNFFSDDIEKHMASPLHALLRKLDIIINSQLRWFLQDSMDSWCNFLKSFLPDPQKKRPAPLLYIDLEADQDEIYLEPEPQEFPHEFDGMLREAVRKTNIVRTMETELMPFTNVEEHVLFTPELSPDGDDVDYEPLENACAVTVQVIDTCSEGPQQILEQFRKYSYLLREKVTDFDPTDIEACQQRIEAYRRAKYEVQVLSQSIVDFPLFRLRSAEIIKVLAEKAEDLAQECLRQVSECIEERADGILTEWDTTHRRILSSPESEKDMADLREFMEVVQRKVVKPLMERTRVVHQQMDMVEGFSHDVGSEVVEKAFRSFEWPLQINMDVMEADRQLNKDKIAFMEQLQREVEEYQVDFQKYTAELEWVKGLDSYAVAGQVAQRVQTLQDNLVRATDRVKSFSDREKLFQIDQRDYSDLEVLQEEYKPYFDLWSMAIEYNSCEEEWLSGKLANLSAGEVEQNVDDNFKDSYKAFKSFEGTPNPQKVAQELRSAVQAFKKNMPIIQGLCQPAIKTSHLLQLFEDMDVDIDMEDGLTLTMCLEAGMMDHVDKVEAISTSAQKQHGLKVALQTMKNEWKAMAFGTFAYKNTGTFLLKGADDVQALLDDHIIKTQAVRGSPFVKPIEKEVKDWEAKLLYIQDLLEQWLMVQRTWLYLEPIFCSEDIVRQMPEEAKKFQAVDKLWRDTMAAVEENPIVLDVSEIENLLLHFTEGNKKLDQIQKCLNDYLETKRLAFPRFFFLSNDELLMILSQTKDPTAVQPHMGKCFEGINRVRFDTNDEIIEAMISVEGEVVDLIKKVNVNEGDKKGNVERWLLEVQESMIHTLTKIMGDSVKAYAETKRDQWVLEWPGQVAIAVDNIYWTREVAEAIEKGKLADYYQVCATQLAELVELVRGELSKLARRTLTAMVTIDVHNRDVVANLRDVNVTSSKDFDWMAQLRYYWAPAGSIIMYETQKPSVVDHCQVSIINATLLYGFEYLGNSDRLVVTPLTDRCYRTLMGAFHLFYGGAPEGPAGTGKTESTKDLAKAMSVQCVVFNCSDGLDYLAMGKFFKGLASSGAWCCFDEFNRIDLEVLSVIAQQVACIQEAIRMKKRRFIFEDTELELIPTCAVNITMNPGYAGRSELPDNLKALFRPCAMMVPDYALIGEIVLYSVGFGNAKPLAAKAVASLRLGSEQLSSQDHYDFGMRALKSILVAAGQLRKKFGNTRAEDILMLSALNDVNLPKFTSNDIPLFLGITGDLFPGVKLPASDYGKLINELEGAAKARHLQPKGSFIHKCTQLWETIMVRHGLMVVGMNVSGKTEVEHVLSDALAAVADGDLYLPVQMHKINPKSIKQGQLYGDFDENTHEWTDGILALTVRYTANADPAYRQWIMLDGPVDAVWIENMNTVLDDNKKLCLNSGEIIKLSGVTTMMFEVEDLTFASPATVSRCGMVFMEQVDIGWRVLMQSWLETAPERLQECTDQLKTLLETNVDQCWEMCQRKIKTPVPVTQNWLVKSLLKLLLALLRIELPLDPEKDAKDIPAKEKEVKVENMFWLALVWSFGATTDSAGRKQMDRFIRSIQAGMPVKDEFDLIADDPTFRPVSKTPFPEKDSVFEYFAFAQSNKWESWTKKIMGFDIPKEALAHQIMVPTTDTVRSAFLLQTLVASEHHVLFSGLTGTGKTVVIQQELLKRFDKERYTVISFAFSAQTTANQTQDIIDGKLDKRKKGTYGPPFGKKCLLFIDDMNMPAKEKYDAQPPIELLRQWMDAGGWYDRKSAEFRNLVDLIFIGAMGPPGAGRPFLTGRYQRRFNLVFVTPFEQESLQRIFQSIMQWFLGKFSGAVAGAANAVVKSTIQLYEDMSAEMLPTPAKSHYTFNLRDLAKVHLGICRCHKKSMEAADDLARCWAHEAHRVFFDRLVTKDDQQWFQAKINDILKENFKKEWKALVKVEPLIWCDFIDPKANYYQQVEDPPQLLEVLNNCLVEYNTMAKRGMDLVLFMAAAQHVSQMVRVLKTPLGNALLVGVGGSGRKSLATLAAFVAEQETFQIEITKSYGMNDWHEDLKRLLIRCGGQMKEVCFLLPDTQIANENFVEEVSGLLNTGEVPNLFNAEDKTQVLELCTNVAAKEGRHGPAEVMAFFVEQCMKNMHIVLAFSPIGENFRRRVRMFPSLVNCCTIDWFHEWPEAALQSVAHHFLGKIGMPDQVLTGVVNICVAMQKSVFELAERFQKEVQRYYYVTPTSYLELINAFKGLLASKQEEVSKVKSRYDVGLDKIMSTEEQVTTMQAELEELKPTLKKTAEDTAQLMVVIEGKQKEAAATEEVVSKDAAETAKVAESATAMKTDCQRDLDKAMPALNSALEALNQLSKGDIVEVKAMGKPPGGVVLVSKALCWCFGVKPKKVPAPDGRSKVDDYWDPAKKELWGDPKLLDRLLYFDKDNIPPDVMTKLLPLETDPEFEPDAIKKASLAACGICKWVRAMIVYDQVAKMVGPKKEALAEAEAKLKGAEDALAIKKAELQAVQDNVAKLLSEFATAKQKKDDLQNQFEVCSKRLVTAEKLINGLGGEKSRWQASSAKLGEQYNNLTGDVLISSGIIAYLGCFLAKYRNESVESWISLMLENKVPSSSTFLLRSVIGEDVAIRQWVIDKLPNDQVSIDNALILSNSRRWPLMIDPQIQANKWIRNSKGDKLMVLRLSQNNYARKLEVGISQGMPVLIENVPETLDPLLEPLLQKAKFKAGNMIMIRLGDSTVEYNEDFRLFITTKLPNPHYAPEICVQVTLLNFMVTPDGLQDQMLGILVAKEEPEVEKKRQNLIIESAQSKAQLKEIEDKILELLSNSKGNILDDDELITTLANSKVTSTRIEERVKEQEKTQALVQETRETYVPVSVRSSAMFFVVADLCKVEPMYQYSLEWFVDIFLLAIKTAEKPERNLQRRLTALQNQFIKLLYEKVCDSLFAKDKLMLSLLLSFKSMEVDSELDHAEKSLLLVGGTTGAQVRPRPVAEWLSDVSWARLSELEDLGKGPWPGLTDRFTKHLSEWKAVFDSDDPVKAPWPEKLQEQLTPLQQALVLLAVRADATVPGLQSIIHAKLGAEFLEPPPFNLEKVYADSNNVTPLIFVLSSGADPMAELNRLAQKNNMFETKAAVSLGQGQGPKAEFAISEGKQQGNWVILQNCHLAVSWMPVLEKLVEELDPDAVADTFRLWLSAMPSPHFPVSVLQNGMKMTVEPPKGLKSNLLRAYLSFEEEWFESAGNTDASRRAFRKMLFGLCFFHALIQERCNYGPLGWNIPYQFSEPDRQICMSQLKMFLEENASIPYAALRYTASEANYGGRVTDAHDRITITNLITDYYCEDILKDGYKFSESGTYYAPKFQPLNGYLEYIRALPINQMPEAFGLHANANLSAAIKEGLGILATANSMLPKGGGGDSGAKTPDQIMSELSSKFLSEIRQPFDVEWLSATYPTDYNESMNTVVNQEALRFNKLLIRVRASLVDIGKAVKGLVIMGPDLEDVASGILLNKQPAFWQKNSYPSLKPMSSYVADLVARMNFFTNWMDNGHPDTYWLSGFFFTQSFLTGQLQNFARKQKLPIDTLIWTFHILKKEITHHNKPEEGCIVYGLFMDGARWDNEKQVIQDSLPKVLFSEIPHMHWVPCEKDKDPTDLSKIYASPIYKTSERKGVLSTTGHSTNFVSTIKIPIAPEHSSKFWTKRGVACLCQLDD
ncbi:unnamed protein product [Effrenium voratum]|uniref:Dynein heavy chain n=1 Tax=Effrenium voratum TaxID=2562239 RepID=A0AA36JSP3_9DINO|nr:unnamed protein product [Effrenium voratum]